MTYQVPMNEQTVTVALVGLEPEVHFVYLAPYSDRREGPETVADYLNDSRQFFPMMAGGAARHLLPWGEGQLIPLPSGEGGPKGRVRGLELGRMLYSCLATPASTATAFISLRTGATFPSSIESKKFHAKRPSSLRGSRR